MIPVPGTAPEAVILEGLRELAGFRGCTCPEGMKYHALNCAVSPGDGKDALLNESAALAALVVARDEAKQALDTSRLALAEAVVARDTAERERNEVRRDAGYWRGRTDGAEASRDEAVAVLERIERRAKGSADVLIGIPAFKSQWSVLDGIARDAREALARVTGQALSEPGLVTDSSLPESHFLREMAIALMAADALAGEDSRSAENAVAWARRFFESVEADPVHNGDCVNACATCTLCYVQQFIAEAREQAELDSEGSYSVGGPVPKAATGQGQATEASDA